MAGSRIKFQGDVEAFTLSAANGFIQGIADAKILALVKAQVLQHFHHAFMKLLFVKVSKAQAWRCSKGFHIR